MFLSVVISWPRRIFTSEVPLSSQSPISYCAREPDRPSSHESFSHESFHPYIFCVVHRPLSTNPPGENMPPDVMRAATEELDKIPRAEAYRSLSKEALAGGDIPRGDRDASPAPRGSFKTKLW